jgi:hypothetical protein
MSLAPRNQAEQDQLEKISKSFFRSQAWEVEELRKGYGHFVVRKDQIRLFVSCHDSEGRKFFPSNATTDALAKKAQVIKSSRHIPTAFVFSSHFPGVVPDIAAQHGLYLFTPGELASVTELQRFHTELPTDQSLTERQTGVLREQLSLSLSIVERFRKTGDRSAAIKWARYAADGAGRYTKAYETLLSLLLEVGEQTVAMSLCKNVLKRYPDSLFFLRSMQTLSAKLGINQDGEDWEAHTARVDQRAASFAERPRSLEEILQKQAAATLPKKQAAPVPTLTATNSRGIVRLVRRILAGSS